jgi:hypothetical protein
VHSLVIDAQPTARLIHGPLSASSQTATPAEDIAVGVVSCSLFESLEVVSMLRI